MSTNDFEARLWAYLDRAGREPYRGVCPGCGALRQNCTCNLADPSITSAKVLGGKTVRVGSRVKHFGQRYTGRATATVVGFRSEVGWIKVLVEPDTGDHGYGTTWDWDRTEVAPDV